MRLDVPDSGVDLTAQAAGEAIRDHLPALSAEIVRQFSALQRASGSPPPLDPAALRAAVEAHLRALVAAVQHDSHADFLAHVQASIPAFGPERAGADALRKLLEISGQAIRRAAGSAVWNSVQPVLDPALAWLLSEDTKGSPLPAGSPAEIAHAYLHTILDGDRIRAQRLVFDALEGGLSIRQIYLDVFQPALYEIGHLWELGRVSIAQEHLATAITQSVLAAIYARVELPTNLTRHAIVACLSGNYHEIGPRMLADLLQVGGFNTRFLGANTPEDSLLDMIETLKPDVVGLPATTTPQVETVQRAIERLRADFTTYRPTVMVGGLAFNLVDGLWRAVRADVWGPDAGQAVDRLVGSSG